MGFSESSAIPAGVKTASIWFPAKVLYFFHHYSFFNTF